MGTDRVLDLDYASVDAGTDPAHLLATMDEVSTWPAVVTLRAWERARLGLRPGARLLDVGCGPGTAALALAEDLGPDGMVVSVDRSEAMVGAARARALAAGHRARPGSGEGIADHQREGHTPAGPPRPDQPGPVHPRSDHLHRDPARSADRPAAGDAGADHGRCRVVAVRADAGVLPLDDAEVDAVRCERTLQWVADPAAVVAELHRVLRPGGRIGLIDTDWSTLVLDTGDEAVAAAVSAHVGVGGDRPSQIGSRLWNLGAAAGFIELEATAATHVWTDWDPDADAVPSGMFSIESLADDLELAGQLGAGDAPGFVRSVKDAARHGRFFMALTMFAVTGRRPPT